MDDFDFQEFDAPAEKRRTLSADDLTAVFRDPAGKAELLSRKAAVERLEERTGCKRSACYTALDPEKSKFRARLSEKGGC